MIEKLYGDYYVCCDACGRELDGVVNDFDETLDRIRAAGWKTSKLAGEWVNYCPECWEKVNRPGPSEFAGIHPPACPCCRGGRPVPADQQADIRRKIDLYRSRQ